MHARVKGIFDKMVGGFAQAIHAIRQPFEYVISAANAAVGALQHFGDALSKIISVIGLIRSFSGLMGGIEKQSFTPSGGGHRTLRTSINIDGRMLGEAVAYYIAKGSQHMGGSADFDGLSSMAPADYSPL